MQFSSGRYHLFERSLELACIKSTTFFLYNWHKTQGIISIGHFATLNTFRSSGKLPTNQFSIFICIQWLLFSILFYSFRWQTNAIAIERFQMAWVIKVTALHYHAYKYVCQEFVVCFRSFLAKTWVPYSACGLSIFNKFLLNVFLCCFRNDVIYIFMHIMHAYVYLYKWMPFDKMYVYLM